MRTVNPLDKVFGPGGSSAGIFLFIAGLVMTYFTLLGLLLMLIGGFVGFTSTSTIIETEKKRVKFTNNLFGIIRTGRWVSLDPAMKITLKKSSKIYTMYSRSNRTLTIPNKDYRVFLCDAKRRPILPLQKFSSLNQAKKGLEALGRELELEEC